MITSALFKRNSTLTADTLNCLGILAIVISSVMLLIEDVLRYSEVKYSSLFFCYSITVFYTVLVFLKTISNHGWAFRKGSIIYTSHLLVLWFISAFALNKEMNLFERSSDWLCILLFLSCAAIVATSIRQYLSRQMNHIMVFILGIATVVFAYYAIYLVPIYAIGILAVVFIGLSLHAFIPLFLLILTISLLSRMLREYPSAKYLLGLGIVVPLVVTVLFVYQWKGINDCIRRIQNQNTLHKNNLPEWVLVSREIPHNFITERFLKADLVYTTPKENRNWFWGDFEGSGFDEPKQHDPLVMIAELLIGKSRMDPEDKIKILKASYNSRHLAQERLWSGDYLKTQSIVTNIRIYPEFRMAYTEKTLTIQNNDLRTWASEQEAIYTFHLPEGAVASSLSLWINGREATSRLTTKGKADSAYKAIVGVERRDPSVLHWQEGNTLSVRVFPCSNKENRKFRIGVTSPLKKTGKSLIYENIWFDGPSFDGAEEAIEMTLSSEVKNLQSDLKQKENKTYALERDYIDQWNITMDEVPLSRNSFQFAGISYSLQDARPIKRSFNPETIYLDINNSWSFPEFQNIWRQLKNKKVYVYNNQLTVLTEENLEAQFKELNKQNFSLFPFYKIAEPSLALVITKSSELSPNLDDLKGTEFGNKLSNFFATKPSVQLYELETSSNPYLKTLKEFRAFRYNGGSQEKLINSLKAKVFEEAPETDTLVCIPSAQLAITKKETASTTVKANTPDHLLRLFAYNDILKRMATTYFANDYDREELIKTADEAFIASPVSSLVVLETQRDYERFGIDESKKSLQNASMNSSGAAPEPEEWMLIILAITTMAYILHRNGYLKKLTF
ncbi:XrtN system VIT domain-containing protein [Pedobacter sp. GR22-6]|uniref:XrtN system VIT domain-containing protein n=1 Tax=Pedobacter sp. GR22-6 TaxID=3127957 RepID=UPI00307DC5CC